jgi:cytochrome P450
VTRYSDCAAFLRDPRLSSAFPGEAHRFALGDGPAAEFMERVLLFRDGPEHTRLRASVVSRLRESWAPVAARLPGRVHDLLRPAFGGAELDVCNDLAEPLALWVLCELLAVEERDRARIAELTSALGDLFTTRLTNAGRAVVDRAVTDLRAQVRRLHPDEDDPAVVDNLAFLFFAGFETSCRLNASACWVIASQAQRWSEVGVSGVQSTVDEVLRLHPPIHGVARRVSTSLEIHGRRLRKGRTLLLLLASANRDPRVFAKPDQLLTTRRPNGHLSFGGGPHACAGARQARAEVAETLSALTGKTLELIEPPTWRRTGLQGPARLRVRVT